MPPCAGVDALQAFLLAIIPCGHELKGGVSCLISPFFTWLHAQPSC